jgi:RNA recognition motif-containing protein
VFKDKGYAFIKFTTKEAATHAIESTHNTEINGSIVKCFWGKENGDPNSVGPNANHQAQQVIVYIFMIIVFIFQFIYMYVCIEIKYI